MVRTDRPRRSSHLMPGSLACSLAALALACAHVPTAEDRSLAENYYDQGVIAVNENRPQQALKLFQDSVAKNPNLPEPHNALGLLYWWSFGRSQDAKAEFEKAIALRPDFAEAANNLGTLLTEMKDYAGARQAYERALAEPMYKTPYVAQVNLAWVAHLQGSDDQAEQLIRTALTAEPGYCVGHRQLARLLEAEGRPKDAEPSWEKFAQLCPNEPEALLRAAALATNRGQPAEAAKQLKKCIEKAAGRPVARECRDALAALPPLPEDAAQTPESEGAAGGPAGPRDLGEAH